MLGRASHIFEITFTQCYATAQKLYFLCCVTVYFPRSTLRDFGKFPKILKFGEIRENVGKFSP